MTRSSLVGLLLASVLVADGCGRNPNCPGPNQCSTGCSAEGLCLCTKQEDCQRLHAYCDGRVCIVAPDGGGPGNGPTGGAGGGAGTDGGP